MTTTSTKPLASVQGKSSLIRPLFSPGLLLQDDDLTQLVDYQREMNRLLLRSMLGCGVLCGLEVTKPRIECCKLKMDVQKGVALDPLGDVIELPETRTVEIDISCCEPKLSDVFWVVICHKEQPCAPRDVLCASEDGDAPPVYTRMRDGYEIQVLDAKPEGCCACEVSGRQGTGTCCDHIATPEDPCYQAHYAGLCACACTCECIVLARVAYEYIVQNDAKVITPVVDHRVRRFVRPVLMKDPLAPLVPQPKLAPPGVVAVPPSDAAPPPAAESKAPQPN